MIYFVDMENVCSVWMRLLSNCTKADRFVLFYTNDNALFSARTAEKMLHAKCHIEFIRCVTGKNALDFQLVAELGVRAAKNPSASYVIVSNDKGFDAAVVRLTARNYKVTRMSLSAIEEKKQVKNVVKTESKPVQEPVENTSPLFNKMKTIIPADDVSMCIRILQKYASPQKKKAAVHGELLSTFGQEKGLNYYYKIREAFLKEK